MEAQEITCSRQGCLYKPICCWEKEDEEEWLCLWHWDRHIETFKRSHQYVDVLDILSITKNDIKFIRNAQKVIKKVFAQKESNEKDQFHLKVYGLVREYLERRFKSLWNKCKWKYDMKDYCKEDPRYLQKRIVKKILMKEKFLEEKEMDFNYNLLSRYLDPKTLFELLSISNENIGQLSLCKNQISTEETKEDICFLFCEEIRSCIFESYYLIECIYNKKECSHSSNLSKNILVVINAEKALYRSYSNNKARVKEPNAREKVFAYNILKENDDLPDNDSINHHDNACKIEDSNITLNSAEQEEILESYYRYLKINSTLIENNCFKDIKIHQIKNYWLNKKNTPYEPYIDVTNSAPICEHYEECIKESFYYLPEICINLCFKHRFHKTYTFCTKYLPLFKLNLRMILEIFNILQSEACTKCIQRFNSLNMILEDSILYAKSTAYEIRGGCFVLIQNEILMNCVEWCESLSKISDSYDIKPIISKLIDDNLDSDILNSEHYWVPTLNDCERNINLIGNMLKIEILEYIMENRFPTYWSNKQVDSKAEEIIEYLQKDYVYKELETNFKKIESNVDAISTQKEENSCFSVSEPNRQMIPNSQYKSKHAFTRKYPDSYEESLESSSDILACDPNQKGKPHEENISYENLSSDEYLNQYDESDYSLDGNNCDNIQNTVSHKTDDFKVENTSSSIKTSTSNSNFMTDIENNDTSYGSKSKNLSGSSGKEESKTQNLKSSETNSSKVCEKTGLVEKYTEEEIKYLVDEAEQEIYSIRKSYLCQFKYKSLSEYFIKKKLYKLKLCKSDDLVLSEFDLSNFGDFREFASDPRWKDQISISSQNKITVKLNIKKNIKILSFIKKRPCEFEIFEFKIHDPEHAVANNFLANYFPENCGYFKLSGVACPFLRINYYFDSIINLSSRVTQELYILRWRLSQHQMVTLFKEFKHVRSLLIIVCSIDLESVPEFGDSLEGSNIKELVLGGNIYPENGYGVEHLIEGLSQSNGFLQNLDTINLYKSKIDQEYVKEKTKDYVDSEKFTFMPPVKEY
ncbi:unnamed protein product [Moneuplotes crassus]|uniref:Uncharacterized protein n=1 Tax=Euplotes crassus TaxID=5936 RepID=A0AAD2D3B6_EUPCR|nr:unnamed protein product [Moneuplotes crassus]